MLYPITSSRVPESIRNQLLYSNVPLGVICKNGTEVFLEDQERVVSLAFFNPGVILGLWEALESPLSYFPKRVWEVSAGARSLFMLPKISQTGLHEKLKKKYGVHLPAPKNSFAHGQIFSEITRSQNFEHEWFNEIIFFDSKWLERDNRNFGWMSFHHHLLEEAWKLSDYNRNYMSYERVWQLFSRYLEGKNIKPNAYLVDTLKHLMIIGSGAVPGYVPAVNTEIPGPVAALQDVYLKDYGLNHYIPTIMMPGHYSRGSKYSYYSLQTPTLFSAIPKSSAQQSVMTEIRELKALVNEFIAAAFDRHLKVENTPIEWLVNHVDFEFFHSDDDLYKKIESSENMPILDKDLIYLPGKMRGRKFAYNSSFVRGCVRLTQAKTE